MSSDIGRSENCIKNRERRIETERNESLWIEIHFIRLEMKDYFTIYLTWHPFKKIYLLCFTDRVETKKKYYIGKESFKS